MVLSNQTGPDITYTPPVVCVYEDTDPKHQIMFSNFLHPYLYFDNCLVYNYVTLKLH